MAGFVFVVFLVRLVHFAIPADAERARAQLNGKRVAGRTLAIDSARKRLPRELGSDGKQKKDGAAAAAAASAEPAAAEAAAAKEPAGPKKPKSARRKDTDGSLDGRTILVNGIAKEATKQQIYKRFKKVAPVDLKSLVYPVPDSDELTAQITFATHKGARNAVEKLDKHVFKGSKMEVVLKTSAKAKRKAAARAGTDLSASAASGTANKKYRLILRNLPFTCTEQQLRKAALKYGPLDELNIIKDKVTSKPKGFAFISYKKPFDAAKALTGLNGKTLGGAEKWNARKVAVDWTVPKDEFERVQAAEKKLGKAKAAATESSDEDSGSDDSDSDDDDSSDEASSDSSSDDEEDSDDEEEDSDDEEEDSDADEDEDDSEFDSEEEEEEKSSDVDQGRTLFVRNVSFDSTEDSLKETFAAFGDITMCKLVRDYDTNRPRGTAFVQFEAKEQAASALRRHENAALSPLECDGRALTITVAVDRRQANQLTRANAKERDSQEQVKKDTRNLKLLKAGAIMVGTAEDDNLSAQDRIKRQNLEMESKAKIKNPNYSVSKVCSCVFPQPTATALTVHAKSINVHPVQRACTLCEKRREFFFGLARLRTQVQRSLCLPACLESQKATKDMIF